MIESHSKFINARNFSQEVEESVEQFDGSYIEAILWLCETKSIDLDSIAKLLVPPIKEKLAAEAESKNMISRVKKLPLE